MRRGIKREKKVYPKFPEREGFIWCVSVVDFDNVSEGTELHLVERRFKTLANRGKVKKI